MSTKHFFPGTEGVVILGLESLVARNKHLALDAPNKVVYNKTHRPSKVAVISGGGSGHEPAWSGYVGDGMLSAAVSGDVFASPATKQIVAAIQHVPSDAGVILCITNYTGDNLHFGLAKEKATQQGLKVAILRMTDDVALGRKQIENTGRRGLAANMFVLKLCGSAAENGYDFEKCMRIGEEVNVNAVTVGSSLDHCHIPGREHHRSVPDNTYVLGMGIHNEPGLNEISPMPPVLDIVKNMLDYCLNPTDKDRAFVEFRKNDVVCLLINNFGGMSNFEIEALTTITRRTLNQDWHIEPERIYVQCFETSLNALGWSVSLLNVSGVGRDANIPVSTLLHLLDYDTKAPAWPKNGHRDIQVPIQGASVETNGITRVSAYRGPKVNPVLLENALRKACKAAVNAEADITKWDIQIGDGDCGEAVESMCKGALKKLDSGLCKDGNLFKVLDEVETAVEEVGGTLGAIVSIILTSFTSNLRRAYETNKDEFEIDIQSMSQAARQALKNLKEYTSAEIGGRTVMDSLIPFCETFEQKTDLVQAVEAAEKGAKSTSRMKPKFGRATYIGQKNLEGQNDAPPPDPGAMAVAIFLRGLLDGLQM